MFANRGDGTFADFADAAKVHRGCAFADFDHDGKVDVVVASLGGRAELWRNVSPDQNAWLNVRLWGRKSNRDGFGAVVRVGGQTNPMTSAVGYASSSHDGVHFGLGSSASAVDVEIQWPGGARQLLRDRDPNRRLVAAEPVAP